MTNVHSQTSDYAQVDRSTLSYIQGTAVPLAPPLLAGEREMLADVNGIFEGVEESLYKRITTAPGE